MKTKLAALLASAVLLSACNGAVAPSSSSSSSLSTAASATVPEQPGVSRIVYDQEGREVAIPAEVERVVATIQPIVALTFAVGAQETLVGADNGSPGNAFFQSVFPQISEAVGVGTKRATDVEAVAAAKPDVVLLHKASGNEAALENLTMLELPTVVLVPETRDQMLEACAIIGEIAGTEEQAAKVIAEFERIESLVAERLKDIPQEQRKKVWMTGGETLSSQTGDMYQHYLITAAGGVNVGQELHGSTQTVSAEQVLAWQPDVIFSIAANPEGPETIMANPQLAAVNGVKNGEVYKLPSKQGSWDYPEPRSACAIVWMAKLMYPEELQDIDVRQIIDDYHGLMYGQTYTELGGSDGELSGK